MSSSVALFLDFPVLPHVVESKKQGSTPSCPSMCLHGQLRQGAQQQIPVAQNRASITEMTLIMSDTTYKAGAWVEVCCKAEGAGRAGGSKQRVWAELNLTFQSYRNA